MGTDAEDALADLYEGRAEAGLAGFRPYTVALSNEFYVDQAWSGPDATPLVEADGQPPKLKWLKDQDAPVGSIQPDVIEVGPITPAFSGGGTDLSSWLEAVAGGEVRHLIITGPAAPNGRKYRILNITTERSLRYMIRAQSEAEFMQGFGGAIG